MARRQTLVDRGEGPVLILIPGLPGRWQWMDPAIDALAQRFRVLSFSLADLPLDSFFDRATARVGDLVAAAGGGPVVLVGVSFGGLVAVHYAASHPDTVARLVLASAPSPRWPLSNREARYVRRPVLSLPLFVSRAMFRLGPEVLVGLPSWSARARFAAWYATAALRWPGSPGRMASWVQSWMTSDLTSRCGKLQVPTLVVTGEPALDRVVPVESSLDYLALLGNARHAPLGGTGHLGTVLRPAEFTRMVDEFVRGPRVGGQTSRAGVGGE